MPHLPAGYLHHLFLVYMYLQMWHLPSLPHNLLLSFYIFATYLDILRGEISPGFNPFFRPVDQQEIENITRGREDMNFMFEWQEQYLTSERSDRQQVRYCSCHENIKFISSS